MGKTAGTTSNVSTTGPAPFQMPYVQQMLQQAQSNFAVGGPRTFSQTGIGGNGELGIQRSAITPFTQNEVAAQEGLVNTANTTGREVADWTQQGYADALKLRDPSRNPYLPGVVDASIRPVFEQLTRSVLPNIRNQATGVGGYGGSRQGIAEGLATSEATKQAMDTSSNIMNSAWQFGNSQANQALQLAPMVQQVGQQPNEVIGSVGAQQRAMLQAQLDELARTYEYDSRLPYTNLAEFANYAKLPLGGSGESSSTTPPVPAAQQIASGVLTLPTLISILQGLFK